MEKLPYQVIGPAGNILYHTHERLRYSRRQELNMLEAGYRIRLNGKMLTKTELRKAESNKQ